MPPLAGKTTRHNIQRFGTGGLNVDDSRLPRTGGTGYWPSHVILSHDDDCTAQDECVTDCAVALVDHAAANNSEPLTRLFYAAKATRAEREAGLQALHHSADAIFDRGKPLKRARANMHPTVKPIDLMRWLVRLVTPAGGVVLDPFAGSGSTGCAAVLEGRKFVGVERESRYVPIACARLTHWSAAAGGDPRQNTVGVPLP